MFWAPCTDPNVVVTWKVYQNHYNDDPDSWKIEQNGKYICGNNDYGFDVGLQTRDTPCCLNTTQDYTLTCTSGGTSTETEGFDYAFDATRSDGYILIDGYKYCDLFEREEVRTIKRSGTI